MNLSVRSVRFFISFAALIPLTFAPSMSQVSMKAGGGIGVISPVSDFGGSTVDYYGGTHYGLGSGLNLHAKMKIGLPGLDLTGAIDYSSLQNSGNSEAGQGSVDISQKIVSLKVGPEFRLGVPALPVTPYVGAHLALNRFTGETGFQGVSKVPSATYSVQSATRFGIGFSAGTEVSIGPFLTLDVNLSYNLMNVMGKEWGDVNPGIDQRIDSYLSLNDESDPQFVAGDDKHFISSARSIHSILLTASILFGL